MDTDFTNKQYKLTDIEDQYIKELDKLCEDHKMEWQPDGIKFRSVLLAAIYKAYWAGRFVEHTFQIQKDCPHSFQYNLLGGECTKCGQTSLQCSSD